MNLDEKFVVDPAAMSPKAASYFRHRPFLDAGDVPAMAHGIPAAGHRR